PWMNRYIGNPVLSGFLKLLYRTPVQDAHCGMRAVRRDVLPRLDLRSDGMEFASEMVIRASKARLRVAEFPITLSKRGGVSKLNPFTDGWRHLRLMLVHNPSFLFLVPGFLLGLIGAATMTAGIAHLTLLGHTFLIHTVIGGSLLVVVGAQLVGFGLCGRSYAVYQLGDRDPAFERFGARIRLEHGLLFGLALILAGLGVWTVVVRHSITHRLATP